MDYQSLFNIIGSLATGGVCWFASQLWSAVKELKNDLSNLRATMPKEYVSKDDYKQDIGRIHELLDKIYDRLAAR